MKLTLISRDDWCKDGDCPAVYATDRGTALIQGSPVTDAEALSQLALPGHETAVEVPMDIIRQAAEALGLL
jgi:hypothetical protein